jgi:hypothetical protein
MQKTLIESSTKSRFASKFTVLEDFRPTDESVLVFKDSADSPNLLILKYTRNSEGKIVQRGTLEEMSEDEFKSKHAPHANWDTTTLREYDKKFQDWRSSTIMEKLEQVGDDDL